MRRIIIVFLLIFATHFSFAQQTEDTTSVLTYTRFIELVKNYHPLMKVAQLTEEQNEAISLTARGTFDPKVSSSLNQKAFDDKRYYNLLTAGLKIPTWIGLDIEAGYDQNNGTYLNPEARTPESGLIYAGINLPIGQGLFMDERRRAVQMAQTYEQMNIAERKLQINNILFSAGKAYWEWYGDYLILNIYREAVSVAQQRLDGVSSSITLGDRPAIDTLEAGIQVQNRQLQLQNAELAFQNASAKLSSFIWAKNNLPLELEPNTIPANSLLMVLDVLDSEESRENIDSLLRNHPVFAQYDSKIDQLSIDRKWQREQLKPRLDFKYRPLLEPTGNTTFSNFSIENYTWGFQFSMPIFLRKERGQLRLNKIKTDMIVLEQSSKRNEMKQKTIAAINTFDNTRKQYDLYTQNQDDYSKLFQGEQALFFGGESSLFMVNSRETAYISARVKTIKTYTLHQKAFLEIKYLLAQLQ